MKTLKLLILRGIPASGKSTFSKKLCKNNPYTWVRVCKDDIRNMCGKYWVPSREKLITSLEESAISEAFSHGYNVVVDATNINSNFQHIIDHIDFVNSDTKIIVEYKNFTIPLYKAIWRDFKRGLFGGRKVGYKVIKQFYNKYYENKF